MHIKTIALAKPGERVVVTGTKTLKVFSEKQDEKTYKFDGVAAIESDVSEAFDLYMKPSLVKENVGSSDNSCFVSFSTGNETFLASLNGTTGVIGLAADEFFKLGGSNKSVERLVSVSMLTIGQEGLLHDLLNPHTRSMSIKQHSKIGLRVEGLTQLVVQTAQDLVQLFVEGIKVMASLQLKSLGCLFNVNVKLAPKDFKEDKMFETSTKFLHFNLTSNDAENVRRIIKQIQQGKAIGSANSLSMLLEDCIVNHQTSIIAEVRGKDPGVERGILEIAESLRGFQAGGSGVAIQSKAAYNSPFAIEQLRSEIDAIRERILTQSTPKIDDVDEMEQLIRDLEICKMDSWDETVLRSLHGYHERKINFVDKGLAWILDSSLKVTPEKVVNCQKKLDQLSAQFDEQRSTVVKVNKELEAEINNYSFQISSGSKSGGNEAARNEVQRLKDRARVGGEALRATRLQLQRCRDELREAAKHGADDAASVFNVALANVIEDRKKVRRENEMIVEEEIKRMQLTVKHEISLVSSDSTMGEEEKKELIRLRHEKNLLTTQLEILRRERKQGDKDTEAIAERHAFESEHRRRQHLDVFRSYRQVCGEYRRELDTRWRSLLDEACKDAVFFSARNQELTERNAQLAREINILRDQLSSRSSE